MEPRHPDVRVQLSGQNGNVGNLMGLVSRALTSAGVSADQVSEFRSQVLLSGSYDEALRVMMEWVSVS